MLIVVNHIMVKFILNKNIYIYVYIYQTFTHNYVVYLYQSIIYAISRGNFYCPGIPAHKLI